MMTNLIAKLRHQHEWKLTGFRRYAPIGRPFSVTGFGAEIIGERLARGYYGWDERCECGKRRHDHWSFERPLGEFRVVKP